MLSLSDYQNVITEEFSNLHINKQPKNLYEPIDYILSLGGKRIRPVLTLMAADIFDGDHKKAISAAKAVEMFHNFSLVHDDIMDDAPLRRGNETVHEKWNLNTGILSGDAMLILAYQYFENYEPKIFQALAKLFSKTALEVCEGQQYDVDFETRDDVTIPEYLKMIEYKTAVLLGAAMKMGAIVAETSEENAPDFTIALGSCSYVSEEALDRPGKPYGSNYSIFESIAQKNPDIMLWGGDNIYLREADWDSQTGIYHRYSHSRKLKEMQPLLAKTQNFAIWDDHDFGPNDSDRSYYNKYVTQKAFKDFWANKFYGTNPNQKEGVFSCFNWGDAEVFLLDNRFFKSPNDRITGEKIMLGNEQMQWLIDALVSSKASFKIIVVGGQVLNTEAVFENYENYKTEKEQLLNEITANKIKGVTFISGDRHFTELSMLKRSNSYSLYDWTVSPLTSGHGNIEKVAKEENKNRVEGSLFAQHVFGTLSFSGEKEMRQMKLTLFDKDGKELWNKVILKKELE